MSGLWLVMLGLRGGKESLGGVFATKRTAEAFARAINMSGCATRIRPCGPVLGRKDLHRLLRKHKAPQALRDSGT